MRNEWPRCCHDIALQMGFALNKHQLYVYAHMWEPAAMHRLKQITTKVDYNSMIDPTGAIHAKEPVKPALAKFGLTLPLISHSQ